MTQSHSCARTFLSFVSFMAVGSALAQPLGLESKLLGHWQLESVDVSGNAPYGAKPQGSMFLDAAGRYSVIVISDGGARSLAYFGTYKADDAANTVVFHVDNATQAAAIGRDEERLVSFKGDELVQQSLPAPGRPVLKVTWKRS
jgi:hypothetical protein